MALIVPSVRSDPGEDANQQMNPSSSPIDQINQLTGNWPQTSVAGVAQASEYSPL
jgi:hypothetical protein